MVRAGVVVTRDEGPDGPLTALLEARGLPVLHWPTIRIAPPADTGPLDRALGSLAGFDWVVFTSPRSVGALEERGARLPEGVRVAAVGASTASSLTAAGWPVDLVPDTQTGEALLAELRAAGVGPGARVFLPASGIARETVPAGLREAGAEVVQVDAYTTEPAPLDRTGCRAALEEGRAAVLTFTSPSTADNLAVALGPTVLALARERAVAVAIGPTTAAAVRELGFPEVSVAEPHSLEGLAERAASAAPDHTGGNT